MQVYLYLAHGLPWGGVCVCKWLLTTFDVDSHHLVDTMPGAGCLSATCQQYNSFYS